MKSIATYWDLLLSLYLATFSVELISYDTSLSIKWVSIQSRFRTFSITEASEGVCAQRVHSAHGTHIIGTKWGFFATIDNTCLCGPYYTPRVLHNLMFDANPQSWAEPIQMSRMTFQCHRRANRSNGNVALLLVLTGVCRSLRSAPSFGPQL